MQTENMHEEIRAQIERITYFNEENSYTRGSHTRET